MNDDSALENFHAKTMIMKKKHLTPVAAEKLRKTGNEGQDRPTGTFRTRRIDTKIKTYTHARARATVVIYLRLEYIVGINN